MQKPCNIPFETAQNHRHEWSDDERLENCFYCQQISVIEAQNVKPWNTSHHPLVSWFDVLYLIRSFILTTKTVAIESSNMILFISVVFGLLV